MKLHDLEQRSFTYSEVGATAGELPAGYHHTRASAVIGTGRDRFEQAGADVLRWGMQRGAGLRVQATTEAATAGTELMVWLGPIPAPCRVVYVLDEADRRGFAYGTLAGHPESGEELFSVRYDPATDEVHAEVVAFSRPATWWSRLGGPVTRLLQRVVTRRYLTGI
ncbi:DUF1990 domain-containing protein [Mycobacterium sp. 134]|uniref:DUF1990 domain-containing protein n=1 Tax=Mycobacterium sp. 134 TaxID=3400425 RepID=UPI003AAAD9E5